MQGDFTLTAAQHWVVSWNVKSLPPSLLSISNGLSVVVLVATMYWSLIYSLLNKRSLDDYRMHSARLSVWQ
jgi:hypothetical protein